MIEVGNKVKVGLEIGYADTSVYAEGTVTEYLGIFKEDPDGDYEGDPEYKVRVDRVIYPQDFELHFNAKAGDTITTLGCNLRPMDTD